MMIDFWHNKYDILFIMAHLYRYLTKWTIRDDVFVMNYCVGSNFQKYCLFRFFLQVGLFTCISYHILLRQWVYNTLVFRVQPKIITEKRMQHLLIPTFTKLFQHSEPHPNSTVNSYDFPNWIGIRMIFLKGVCNHQLLKVYVGFKLKCWWDLHIFNWLN